MDIGKIPLFALLTDRMNWLSSRQSVLSENVANAATPNYAARDLRPVDFASQLAGERSLKTTNQRHFGVGPTGSTAAVPETAGGEGGTPGGNSVSLEQEMIKLSDTQVQYQTAANLYQKSVNMFRTALGGGRG